MFLDKLKAMFQTPSKKNSKDKSIEQGQHTQRRRVDPTHIGDLGEYKIHVQLRQFSKEYRYLDDVFLENPRTKTGYSQIDHVLITPYGLFVIETKNYLGRINGKRGDKYWRVNGKFNMPNPLRQNYGHVKALQSILKESKDLKYVSVISFTKRCELYIDTELREIESDTLVVFDIKLTEVIERKLARLKRDTPEPPLSESDVVRIFNLIRSQNIADSSIRSQHIQRANALEAENQKPS